MIRQIFHSNHSKDELSVSIVKIHKFSDQMLKYFDLNDFYYLFAVKANVIIWRACVRNHLGLNSLTLNTWLF